jgi:RimJ/RimL family protein N-acetyltransferase
MAMRLVVFPDARGFLERAEPFFLADEARHHLPFALALSYAKAGPGADAGAVFFATIEAEGGVIASAIRARLNLILSLAPGADFAESPVLEELAEIIQIEFPDLPGVLAPPAAAQEFAEAWSRRTGNPWRLGLRQRTHELRAVRPLVLPPGRLRVATTADRATVVPWLEGMHLDIFGPDVPFDAEAVAGRRLAPPEAPGAPFTSLYLWVDDTGTPQAMAGAQATTATGVRIGAVYTPPENRRRGYGTAVVSTLSQHMLDLGRRACYLFTDLSNPTSNHIYKEIGYEPVADIDEIRFW